jgi:hypothetical protein
LNKVKYYASLNQDLGDPKISPKKWWGIVKSLYGQEMRVAVPTFIEGQNIISDARAKAELLNDYFSSQSMVPFQLTTFFSCPILPPLKVK